MRRVATALLGVLLLSGCTQTARHEPGPTPSTPASSPTVVHTPVARVALAPEPIKEEFLLHNPLYRAGQITAVSCSLPTAKLTNKQAMIRYATAFVGCLAKAWGPVITRAGFDLKPVGAVHSAPTGTDSVCGVMEKDVGAFYCSTDLGIYFNWPDYIVEGNTQEDTRTAVQYLIAHEYGHHVQELTGMADEYADRYDAGNAAQRKMDENRNEMQAHCFAAAFFGANQVTLGIRGYRRDHYGHIGYDRNDASYANFDRWLRQGFKGKGPAGCNTWVAPASKVTGA